MASRLIVNIGVFQADIDAICESISKLVDASIDEDAKKALSDFIAESSKSPDILIETITPFYKLNTDEAFQKEFAILRSEFEKTRRNVNKVKTHCKVVREHLTRLSKDREWKKRYPWVKKSLLDLKRISSKWVNSEKMYSDQLSVIFNAFSAELFDIDHMIYEGKVTEARKKLASYIDGALQSCDTLSDKLGNLQAIGTRL